MNFVPQTDFTGAGFTYDSTYTNFGLTVYKQYESLFGYDVRVSDHIQYLTEMGAGAHYYAQSQQTAAFIKAQISVNLSSISVDTKGTRAAFISMSIIGYNGACDMGIKKLNGGWYAFGYSHIENDYTQDWSNSLSPVANASSVTITITPKRENGYDKVIADYTWYNSGGVILSTQQLQMVRNAGKLFNLYNGKPFVRFQRFMSLIPASSAYPDTNDGSYLSGNIITPKLYTTNTSSVTWGTSYMDYIWSVQGWNISALSVGNGDLFSCSHDHYVY